MKNCTTKALQLFKVAELLQRAILQFKCPDMGI